MKKLAYILLFPLLIGTSSTLQARDYDDYLGLPGDNLNLFAVMKLFQESATLEDFERGLNDQDNMINNLDLNGDNRIDYIRVIDNPEGNVHYIVLQVAINVRENQDVAVFIVERESNDRVRIQLIGDEALYGKNYIVEPNYSDYGQNYRETPNPGYTGYNSYTQGQTVVVNHVTAYEVATWPLIRFMFLPGYVVWHSPWYWGYYPHWWHSWHPYYWHYYCGYHSHWYPEYYGYYRITNYHHHHDYWNTYYHSSRHHHSSYVSARIESGHYKSTYSRPESRRAGSERYTRTYSASGNHAESRSTVNRNATTYRSGSSNSTGTADRSVKSTSGRTVDRSAEPRASRPSEALANSPSYRAVSNKSTVKTENRKPSESQAVSGHSQSRRVSGSTQVKSNSASSRGETKTADRPKSNSATRR